MDNTFSTKSIFKSVWKFLVGIVYWFVDFRKNFLNRFGALRIRVKLVIIIALLFIGLTSILSFIVIQSGRRVLNQRMAETCNLSLKHTSQALKDDLIAYYRLKSDANSFSVPLGQIREAILTVYNENISGLIYIGVIDRNGIIIAHTDSDLINSKVSPMDSVYFVNLAGETTREIGDIVEYIHPLFYRPENPQSAPIYLGTTILGFSKSQILQPIKDASRNITTVTFIIIFISIIVIFIIARRMTGQIEALADGVRKVGRGNLNVQIPVTSRDELGHLAKEFNIMIVHLREKLQMQKFVSKLTVQMIRKRSSSEDLQPVGERRVVTLMFSDVRSFSALTERLGAEEIVKLINIYLDLQARIVEEHGGIVDKFMGDQIMAIFLGETQADDGIHAAVEIQRSIRELNMRRRRKGEVVLNVGIGLNIGAAVMGNMGSKSRLDYTVIGDVVNLAARLCSIAKPGQVLAPIEMVDALNGEYPTIRLNPIMVKGRSQPVDVFEVDYDRAIIM